VTAGQDGGRVWEVVTRREIAARRAAYLAAMSASLHPMAVLRCDRHLEDAADDDAVLQHVVVVIAHWPDGHEREVRLRISGTMAPN
jgi:hypothetical protein